MAHPHRTPRREAIGTSRAPAHALGLRRSQLREQRPAAPRPGDLAGGATARDKLYEARRKANRIDGA